MAFKSERVVDQANAGTHSGPTRRRMVVSRVILWIGVAAIAALLARPNGRATYTFEFLTWCYVGVCAEFYWTYWRRHRRLHPTFPLALALTTMSVFECAFDWAAYVIYDPDFRLRTPEVFPFNLGPFPIPWAMIAGYGLYFLLPPLAAVALARRVSRTHIVGWSIGFGLLLGTIPVLVAERILIEARIYSYLQTIPGLAMRGGEVTQQRIDMVVIMAMFMAALAALWAWRDEHDRWLMERWAARRGYGPRALALGTVALVWGLYALTMVPFVVERQMGVVDQQSDPQPYVQLPPYDPDGLAPDG